MGRSNKKLYQSYDAIGQACREGGDVWRRQRKERANHSPSILQNFDIHGILFAVVAVVFVVYPLIQWALGR